MKPMSSIVEVVKYHALHSGARVVYVFIDDSGKETRITYSDLNRKASQIAANLLQQVSAGERVVLLIPQGVDYIYTFFGCLYAGVIAVPFYPPTTTKHSPKVLGVVANSEASMVITADHLLPLTTECLEENPSIRIASTSEIQRETKQVKLPLPKLEDVAFLQYTSGSTGNPKGVMVCHRNILSNVRGLERAGHVTSKDVFCSWLPLFHDLGLITGFLLPAYVKAKGVLMTPARFIKRPLAWLESITKFKATICGAPNFAFAQCVRRMKADKMHTIDLSTWRVAYNAAEPIEALVLEEFVECFKPAGFSRSAFFTSYGMAEVTAYITASDAVDPVNIGKFNADALKNYQVRLEDDKEKSISVVSCGRPEDDHQVRIVSGSTFMEMEDEQMGEVWVAGPSVAQGYWGDRERTLDAFHNEIAGRPGEKFLRTGDLGFIHNGELYISGRKKDILIIRGRNYTPHDLELCSSRSHEAYRPGGAVAAEVDGQLVLIQEIERKFVKKLDFEAAMLQTRTALFEQFELVLFDICYVKAGQLPRTSSGKLRRSTTRQMYIDADFDRLNAVEQHRSAADSAESTNSAENFTATEKALADIWRSLFTIQNIAQQDSFIALGGDSISATQLMTNVQSQFGVQLTIRDLFEQSSLARMAACIDRLAEDGSQVTEIDTTNDTIVPTVGQRQLWIIDQVHQGSAQYNLPFTLTLKGELNRTALKQALNHLIIRHLPLRTAFKEHNGGCHLEAAQTWDLTLETQTLFNADATELDNVVHEFCARAFDLSNPLKIRAQLLETARDNHCLTLVIHHLAADGWSKGLIQQEFSECYNAAVEERSANLVELTAKYHHVAQSQNQWLEGEEAQAQRDYWRNALTDIPTVHNVPLDYPRGEKQSFVGECLIQKLDDELTNKIQGFAKTQQTTLFMVLHAAFSTLLSRYSGDSDVVVGSSFANRELAQSQPLVGFFTNALPIRSSFNAATNFASLLAQSKVNTLRAYENQQVPFELIASDLNQTGNQQHNPVFQVMLTLQNTQEAPVVLNNLDVSEREPAYYPALFDLTLDIFEQEDGLRINWIYAQSLFNAETIATMSEHFSRLLQAVITTPTSPIVDLPLFTDAQQQTWINTVNRCDSVGNTPQQPNQALPELYQTGNFLQWFEAQAQQHPEQVAVSNTANTCKNDSVCRLTYAELNSKANQLARVLQTKGVKHNDNVLLLCARSIEQVVALLAIQKAGATYIPADMAWPEARVTQIANDANVALILVANSAGDAKISLQNTAANVVEVSEISAFVAEQADTNIENATPADNVYCIYTSGSTGKPKGVPISQDNLRHYLQHAIADYLLANSADINESLVSSSLSFDATVTSLLTPLATGKTLTLIVDGEQTLLDLAAEIRAAQQPLLMKLTPAHLIILADMLQGYRSELAHCIVIGGEQLTWATLAPWTESLLPNARFINEYGPTEATVGCSTFTVSRALQTANQAQQGAVPIGRPIVNTQLYILNSALQMVPHGVLGELYIGGAGVAAGYVNNQHAERFIASPFAQSNTHLYRTGDLARWDESGTLHFERRIDAQVKLRGFRIELAEIEAQLQQMPSVRLAKVIAVPASANLAAFIVANGAQVPADTLRNQLKKHLPEYMLPAFFRYVIKLPLTTNGKVDTGALLASLKNDDSRKTTQTHSSSQLTAKLQNLWAEVLERQDPAGIDERFFDLGGNSLLAIKLRHRIEQTFDINISVTEIFSYPTVRDMAKFLQQHFAQDIASAGASEAAPTAMQANATGDIAVIGMATRFPDARDTERFWQNLCDGKESIHFFSDDELLEAGVAAGQLEEANYVKSGILLDDIDLFDADYFGVSPREAEILDPQQRLLLEVADTALQNAGYGKRAESLKVGVFAGVGETRYLLDNLMPNTALVESYSRMALMLGSNKDFVATRLAHKLNLRGPAMTIGTACSTSLVAIAQAVQTLQQGQCHMAIAGGSSLHLLKAAGYAVVEGGIGSLDGHCRPFDANATGARAGDGSGVVVLKPLAQAQHDGDTIHAVIKGVAVNNDGQDKVGFTAPSVEGQAQVLRQALASAGVAAESIGYIETHGTGTKLGDPMEIAALKRVYAKHGDAQSLALGTLKANIGHLDSAAGVAGFIKAVHAVKHGILPSNINFAQLNTDIDLANTPLYFNSETQPWPTHSADGQPENKKVRRAGISSFGIGGTNAHIIIEQPPEQSLELAINEPPAANSSYQLLPLSAKAPEALTAMSASISDTLNDDALTAQVFTQQEGRAEHNYRTFAVGKDAQALQEHLLTQTARKPMAENQQVVFLFTGQGSQYVQMAQDLYARVVVFKQHFDNCADQLCEHIGQDIRTLLFAADANADALAQTEITQPLLFSVEYALAQVWQSLGVTPDAMIGHSLGEYVAATVAGVFELNDALRLVSARGKLMQQVEAGSMLSVVASRADLDALVTEHALDFAAENGPELTVVSGPSDSINALAQQLTDQHIIAKPLNTSHAYHSASMEPILAEFKKVVASVKRHAPQQTLYSNVTGEALTDEQAQSADYWVQHLRQPVKFAQNLAQVMSDSITTIFLEVGPGRVLVDMAKRQVNKAQAAFVASLRRAEQDADDVAFLLGAAGQLWSNGVGLHLAGARNLEGSNLEGKAAATRRVAMPTYPYQRQRYWISAQAANNAVVGQTANNAVVAQAANGQAKYVHDWFYNLEWSRQHIPSTNSHLLSQIAENAADYQVLVEATASEQLQASAQHYCEQLNAAGHHAKLHTANLDTPFAALVAVEAEQRLVYFAADTRNAEYSEQFSTFFTLAKTLATANLSHATALTLVTQDAELVTGAEEINATAASLVATAKVLQQENPLVSVRHIDLTAADVARAERVAKQLVAVSAASTSNSSDALADSLTQQDLALRGRFAWTATPVRQAHAANNQSRLKAEGVYLITGGFGNIGQLLASQLATNYQAKLALLSRSPVPQEGDSADSASAEKSAQRLAQIKQLEALGAQVEVVQADVTDPAQMQLAFAQVTERFGRIDGVIHCAADVAGSVQTLQDTSLAAAAEQVAAKVAGTHILETLVDEYQVELCVMMSSLASLLGGLGFAAYAAGNRYMDGFVQQKFADGDSRWIALNWDGWLFDDPAAHFNLENRFTMNPEQGWQAFTLALQSQQPAQLFIATADLAERQNKWFGQAQNNSEKTAHQRPTLSVDYEAPRFTTETQLVDIWADLLGIEGIGINDNFFDLDGDSLLLTRVVTQINQQWKINLSLQQTFEAPTIAQMAEEIGKQLALNNSQANTAEDYEEEVL